MVWQQNGGPEQFFIDVSGITEPIEVVITDGLAEVRLFRNYFSYLRNSNQTIICLPGICHLLTEGNIDKMEAMKILRANHLLGKSAAGVITIAYEKDHISIKPIIWVRDTATLYEETACASGSLVAAYHLNREEKENEVVVFQPSGTSYRVVFYPNKTIGLSGPIEDVVERTIEII